MGRYTQRKRVEALRGGRTQWGHGGTHRGRGPNGTCPSRVHHHCDDFCELPTETEMRAAGVTKPEGGWGSRG